jgi:hypothetical protein
MPGMKVVKMWKLNETRYKIIGYDSFSSMGCVHFDAMKLYLFSIRDGDSFVGMSSPSHHLTLL